MKRLPGPLSLITALLLTASAQAAPDEIGGADIINRVERVQRVSAETAATWYAGVSNLDAWPARLEQALLKTVGPGKLRDSEAGLQMLEALLEPRSSEDTHVSEGAMEALSVLIELIRRAADAEAQRDSAASELEREREAHRQTLEKLRSLREIDQQLDERKDSNG